VYAQQIGQRTEKCRAEPRVLHFDAREKCGVIRLLQKGEIMQAVQLEHVHAIAFDDAEPCTIILVYEHGCNNSGGAASSFSSAAGENELEKRLLLDFATPEENLIFRCATDRSNDMMACRNYTHIAATP
jgi:hypothetical protein